MTEFGLMFSKKYKTVNWGSAERSDLKKQSQFGRGLNYVKLVTTMAYEDFSGARRRENKANQSQFISVQCSADSVKIRKRNLKKQSQFYMR